MSAEMLNTIIEQAVAAHPDIADQKGYGGRSVRLCGYTATAYLSVVRDGVVRIALHHKRESRTSFDSITGAVAYLVKRVKAMRKEIDDDTASQRRMEDDLEAHRIKVTALLAAYGLAFKRDSTSTVVIPWMPAEVIDDETYPFTIEVGCHDNELTTDVKIGGGYSHRHNVFRMRLAAALDTLKQVQENLK
jgi:hypothetical protein